MPIATTTALTISAIASVASGVVGAIGAIQQGQAAKNQAAYQSAIYKQQADQARLQAAADAQTFQQRENRAMATRRALLGGTGADLSSGSPLLTSEDFAGEAALQALRIRNGGDVQATRLEQSAGLAELAGRNAQSGSYFRAGSSLLAGAGSAAKMYGFNGGGTPTTPGRYTNSYGTDFLADWAS